MQSLPVYFRLLLGKINPPDGRRKLAKELVGDLREWLEDHDFETVDPHTRLIGSYARFTAVHWIKDVDVLVFLPDSALDRTPNAVLLDLRKVLEDYPGASVNATGQRRSICLELEDYDFLLDIVPAVAPNGLDKPLKVPDRPLKKWIDSDPLGYMARLADLNREHAEKVIPLVKMIKAWRDAQMKIRRPKSYMLEVMVVNAIEQERITLIGESWPSILAQLFAHWADKYHDLMESGSGVPRICDPQLGHLISGGWERSEFETFMRRVREADCAAQRALAAEDSKAAATEWARVFGESWPTEEEVEAAARAEAAALRPGVSKVAASGLVVPGAGRSILSQPTSYHGGRRSKRRMPRFRQVDRPAEQIGAMYTTFSQFSYRGSRRGGLVWRGELTPTFESPSYAVRIVHDPGRAPRVFVEDHDLDPRCRHLYSGGALCLYWPEEWTWSRGESLAATIVPWIAFWLYYYELWQETGKWLGPISPHGLRPEQEERSP